jgi:PAS domain S-box-containing protein
MPWNGKGERSGMSKREVILVVDDSEFIRDRMESILSANNYHVVLRKNGEEGILAALEYNPDVIVMDVNMPKMDGYRACRILKRYPQTKTIPLAVFTDTSETDQKVKFFEIGVEDFIVKDADEEEVVARIAGLLRWRKSRDKILRERDKLSNLLDSLSDAVMIVDNSGKLIFYNHVASVRFGLIPEILGEKRLRDVLPESQEIMDLLSIVESHHEFEGKEIEIERDGEKRVYFADVCRVFLEFSDDVGGALVLKDVTAERESERVKAEFYSMIAHELRTPISVILGYTELMLKGKSGEITKLQGEFLSGVEQKSRKLLKLVNDFLEVSRLEGKFVNLNREIFDLDPLVKETVAGLRLLADDKDIVLGFESCGRSVMVDADRDKLEQVFINLIENSVKYTEQGGEIEVGLDIGEGTAEVSVKDNGMGMSEEEVKYIFDRFKRLGLAEKNRIKGTGLGLAIVKEIIEAHGGEIDVESEQGRGSVFRVRVPIWEGGDELPEEASELKEEACGSEHKFTSSTNLSD